MPAVIVDTPAGPLLVVDRDGEIAETRFADFGDAPNDESDLLRNARVQLDEYFAGRRHAFDLPLAGATTPYQERVRRAMLAIPYGQTRSYGELAHRAGGGPRAIGQACGANPLPILVPCHRVVAAHGLGGYSGGAGLATKRMLLELESNGIAG